MAYNFKEIEKLQNEAKSNDTLNQLKNKDNYEEIKEAIPNSFHSWWKF